MPVAILIIYIALSIAATGVFMAACMVGGRSERAVSKGKTERKKSVHHRKSVRTSGKQPHARGAYPAKWLRHYHPALWF